MVAAAVAEEDAVAAVVAAADPVIEVLEAFELASLVRRNGTLDGGVPLRAAQACLPFLEGNGLGLQVRLSRALTIERSLGRAPRIIDERASIGLKAAIPRLCALGYVTEPWPSAFARSLVHEHKGVLHLFTGLLVRPPDGTWLRIASSANRRSFAYDVGEVFIPDGIGFVPLVIPIRPRAGGALRIDAEIATVSCVIPDVEVQRATLGDAPELARAHAEFFDAVYFAKKKGEPTKKYRKTAPYLDREDGPTRVVEAGPVKFTIERKDQVLSAASPTPIRSRGHGVTAIDFVTLLPFEAAWDGLSLVLEYEQTRLQREAAALERLWKQVMGAPFLDANKGALWYLTKYFTPHPPGEPHFFVKPWAFVQTPPGWSSVVDGVLGDGFEVMRGVVQTDWFHAAPAVFRVFEERIRVREGTRLLEVLPFPRALANPKVRAVAFGDSP